MSTTEYPRVAFVRMRAAVLVAAFVALCAATSPLAAAMEEGVERVLETDDGDDCSEMLAAFVKGQRGLIAEFKVATLMVANAVMPGMDFDLTINTSIAHPNVNASCPNPRKEFPLFIENQFNTCVPCRLCPCAPWLRGLPLTRLPRFAGGFSCCTTSSRASLIQAPWWAHPS